MKKSKLLRFGIISLLLLNAISATVAGIILMQRPDGSLIGINKSILKYSPFNDFLVPGIILFICNGLSSIFVVYKLIKNTKDASLYLLLQGLISIGWITIQSIMLKSFNMLHLTFGMIGILFLVAGYNYFTPLRR